MMHRTAAAIVAGFVLLGGACGGDDDEAEPQALPTPSPATTFLPAAALINTGDGSVIVKVEVAQTDEQRQQGLMGRESLADDHGMVFMFFEEHSGGFWMKNTLIPLSIAFFDEKGIILEILDMDPCIKDPCEVYDPGVAYYGALEVNQGMFDEWGVDKGDHLTLTF